MRTIKQNLKKLSKEQFELLNKWAYHSNSLYNTCLYTIKQYYDETGKYIGINKLYQELKNDYHAKQMTSFLAQEIMRLADKNYRSYFALLKKKLQGQYADDVHKPKYRKPKSHYILIFNNQRAILRNNVLKLTKKLKLKFTYNLGGKLKQVIIKPNNFGGYTMLITYQEKEVNINVKKKNFLSLDLGLNNLVAGVSNVGLSFIINGKVIKSYNNYYNKKKAQIQSELIIKNEKHYSRRLQKLTEKRYNLINNYFNNAVKTILNYCIKYQIGTVVLGYNESWKQNINLGHKTNQQFAQVPFYLFKQKLRSKLEQYKIELKETEENYTSKCSFIDNEAIQKHSEYKGKRIKRGLFQTAKELLINADINAACNIAKKVFPKFIYNDGIKALIVTPKVFTCNLSAVNL